MAMLDAVPNLTLAQLNEASFAWVEHEYHQTAHRELSGATPLPRFIQGPSVMCECPDSATLRRHFRIEVKRTVRRSDGTVSLDGIRFEIPHGFCHLRELSLRYARWDRSCADIVDAPGGANLATIYPLDKARWRNGRHVYSHQPWALTELLAALAKRSQTPRLRRA